MASLTTKYQTCVHIFCEERVNLISEKQLRMCYSAKFTFWMKQILCWCHLGSQYGALDIIQHAYLISKTRKFLRLAANMNAASVTSQNSGPYARACGTEVENFSLHKNFHILQHTKYVSNLDKLHSQPFGGNYFPLFQLPIK